MLLRWPERPRNDTQIAACIKLSTQIFTFSRQSQYK